MANKKMVKVLKIEPMKKPEVVEIENELPNWQAGVGGYIECVYPFEEEVGIICNKEGKINAMPLNRALLDETGKMYDIVAGPFFIVGLDDEAGDFDSLTDEQLARYAKMFEKPQLFYRDGRGIGYTEIDTEEQ